MTSEYPLLFRDLAKAANLLGLVERANPIGLARNHVSRSLEFSRVFQLLPRPVFSATGSAF